MVRSLKRIVRDDMGSLTPLAPPFQKWGMNEALLYRGAVSVVAGPPGCGKTITATNIVHNLSVPTLYISNDSTRFTMAKRTYAMTAGIKQKLAAEIIETNPDQAASVLEDWDNVRFTFESNPSIENIANAAEAFREIFGEYPHLIVVDILMNIDHEGVSEQNYWRLFPALKDVAANTQSAVLGIHHTSQGAKYKVCPPSSSIMGKANHLQELIVTQIMRDDKIFYAVVKNRNGESDETGDVYFTLRVDASMNLIFDELGEDGIIFHDGPGVPESEKIREGEFD